MKKIYLASCFILFSSFLFAQVSPQEKQVLLDFYSTTNGEHWNQTWDLNQPVNDWKGVTVENNKVTGISLLFNNIEGTLPASLGQLENLRVLELSFNKITGTLPTEFGALQQLETLAFNGNRLTGSIPASYGRLKSLKQLHLSSNKLSGEIPTTLNNLTMLEIFNVFDNKLTGALPATLVTNKNLKELMVAENNFSNPEILSIVLLSNSGIVDLNRDVLNPSAKTVIAIESNDDDN